MKTRHSFATLVFSVLAAAAMFVLPGAASAQFVTGLAGASGSTIGPDGAIYVTESQAGRLTRVDPVTGEKSTVVSGLPVLVGGAVDVAFIGATPYVLVSLVGDPLFGGLAIDGIYRVDGPDSFSLVADIGAYSADNLPDPSIDIFLVNGVQYAMDAYRGGFLVTDGHHDRVLKVSLDGEISEFKVFGNKVPTGLEIHGNRVFMAEAGPVPHNPEDGRIVKIDARSGDVTEVAAGAPLLVDVEFGLGRTLYGLSQGNWDGVMPGDPALPFTGSLVRVNPNGTFTVVATALNLPTSVEFIGNTAYIVSLAGEIVRIPGIGRPPFGHSKSGGNWWDNRHDNRHDDRHDGRHDKGHDDRRDERGRGRR